jgi:hypothetical protein
MASASLHETFANWVDYPPLDPYAPYIFTNTCLFAFRNKEFDAQEFDAIYDDCWNQTVYKDSASIATNLRSLETQCQKQIFDIHMAQFVMQVVYREYLLDGIKLLKFLKNIAGEHREGVTSFCAHCETQARAMRQQMLRTVDQELVFSQSVGQKPRLTGIMEQHSRYVPKTYYIPVEHTEEVIPFIKIQHARMEEKGRQILDTQLGMIQRHMVLYREFAMRGIYPVFPHMPELNEVLPEMRHEFICHRLSGLLERYSERRLQMQANVDSFITIAHQLFPHYGALIEDRAGYFGRRPKP